MRRDQLEWRRVEGFSPLLAGPASGASAKITPGVGPAFLYDPGSEKALKPKTLSSP
jgi:hypothetical protein